MWSPIPKTRLAASVTASFSPSTGPARQRVAPQPPERDEQVVAGAAVQAGQREPLVDALEALLGGPARIGAEGGRWLPARSRSGCRPRSSRAPLVSWALRGPPARRPARAADPRACGPPRSRRRGRPRPRAGRGRRPGTPASSPARRRARRRSRHRGRAAERELGEAPAREADLGRQPLPVLGRPQPGRERGAVAVVACARLVADDQPRARADVECGRVSVGPRRAPGCAVSPRAPPLRGSPGRSGSAPPAPRGGSTSARAAV